jgi:hypothetical protein
MNRTFIVTPPADVTPPQAKIVRRVGSEMLVDPRFYAVRDVESQSQIWDCAHELAWLDGWAALDTEEVYVHTVDEDGTERWPLMRVIA